MYFYIHLLQSFVIIISRVHPSKFYFQINDPSTATIFNEELFAYMYLWISYKIVSVDNIWKRFITNRG